MWRRDKVHHIFCRLGLKSYTSDNQILRAFTSVHIFIPSAHLVHLDIHLWMRMEVHDVTHRYIESTSTPTCCETLNSCRIFSDSNQDTFFRNTLKTHIYCYLFDPQCTCQTLTFYLLQEALAHSSCPYSETNGLSRW